ncbi:DUF4148 domain-containing protein [Paraburkholderia sediminicola]|uniref:DUF4148 domain-containing protein n=1 Tax=Paraburkholderia sediminicola TaxID=458836 RepID=UPI0038B87D75
MQTTRRLIVLFASAALASGALVPVLAQTEGGGGANAATGATASAANLTKAQRKQARKEARAKNKAEVKKLEDEGFRPGTNDPNYPDNLQNAMKKAAKGASQ